MKKFIYLALCLFVAAGLCLLSHQPVLWLAAIAMTCAAVWSVQRAETIHNS